MNLYLQNKLVEVSRALISSPVGAQKHFTFLILRNKIVSIGWNNKVKTNPWNQKYGYKYDKPHSELIAVKWFPYSPETLRRYTAVNVRISRTDTVINSKPCLTCQGFLATMGIKEIWYTSSEGQFLRL